MTERVFFHIGAPKTGTTYLQDILVGNRDRLARAGILYVGERWQEHVYARLALLDHPRLKKLPAEASRGWQHFVDEVRHWHGPTAIISHELFGAATAEQAARGIADLAPADVHLVFTARDFVSQLPAVWQEHVKWMLKTPLSQWKPKEHGGALSDWSWRTIDPVGVLGRWTNGVAPDHVHIVTMPRSPRSPETLWERFAATCGIPEGLCDLTVARPNESLGVAEAELLRRVNEQLEPPVTGAKEASRWVRNYLAHEVLVPRGGRRFGLRPEQAGAVVDRSRQTVDYLARSGFVIHGDLDDLLPGDGDTAADHPDDVTDAELLSVAVETIATMLQTVRARTLERDAARRRLGGLAGGLVDRAGRGGVTDRVVGLARRARRSLPRRASL